MLNLGLGTKYANPFRALQESRSWFLLWLGNSLRFTLVTP